LASRAYTYTARDGVGRGPNTTVHTNSPDPNDRATERERQTTGGQQSFAVKYGSVGVTTYRTAESRAACHDDALGHVRTTAPSIWIPKRQKWQTHLCSFDALPDPPTSTHASLAPTCELPWAQPGLRVRGDSQNCWRVAGRSHVATRAQSPRRLLRWLVCSTSCWLSPVPELAGATAAGREAAGGGGEKPGSGSAAELGVGEGSPEKPGKPAEGNWASGSCCDW